METYFDRILEEAVRRSLEHNPVTAILGPRQCGKSTLVKYLLRDRPETLLLDLEKPSDLQKLADPEWFLSTQLDKLVCIDEVQRQPEIFPLIRALVDEEERKGMYILLGSVSRDLLQQSSESLAGRISYRFLTPFLFSEVSPSIVVEEYINRGGFPRSLLADNDLVSFEWRSDFIINFLERDLQQFIGFSVPTMRRLWQMLAHENGQTINLSRFGSALGVSHTTVRNYLDLLESTFMVKQVQPYWGNTKKRLVKSPKVYIADSGIAAALLNLKNIAEIAGHPSFGALWESVVLSNIVGHFPKLEYSFFRTNHGNEVDFVISYGDKKIVVECKASSSPKLTQGNYLAIAEINPKKVFIASLIEGEFAISAEVQAVSLPTLISKMKDLFD